MSFYLSDAASPVLANLDPFARVNLGYQSASYPDNFSLPLTVADYFVDTPDITAIRVIHGLEGGVPGQTAAQIQGA